MRAILVFDLCETVLITALLVVTIPFACVVYRKLLFVSPFAENFTFKLIVLNGTTVSWRFWKKIFIKKNKLSNEKWSQALLSGVGYLIFFQLCSYAFMIDFYLFVQRNNLSSALGKRWICRQLISYYSQQSSISSSKKWVSIRHFLWHWIDWKQFCLCDRKEYVEIALFHTAFCQNDRTFFFISIIGSLILTLPGIIDLCTFTASSYQYFEYETYKFIIPRSNTTVQVLWNHSPGDQFIFMFRFSVK